MTEENAGVLAIRLVALHEDVTEIKDALSKLSDAITKLALVEERQTQTAQALERAFIAIERLEARVAVIELKQPHALKFAVWMDRAIWAALALLATYAARQIGLLK